MPFLLQGIKELQSFRFRRGVEDGAHRTGQGVFRFSKYISQNISCRYIVCSLGCRIKVQVEGEGSKKEVKYAQQEVSFPGRILTTTVSTHSPEMPLLPVRSNKPFPKEKLITCMKQISKHSVTGSVQLGQTVIENILGLGADIIACWSMPVKLSGTEPQF